MKQPQNRGLLFEEIVPDKDGVLGSAISYAGKTIIRADGQWEDVGHERQSSDSFDTFSCVSFGLNNQEELYMKNRYGIDENHSDRFLAKASDTQPNGNTPQKVYEARRKKGFVFELEWPWTTEKTWTEYMADIPQQLYTLAIGRAAKWRFWHDYVQPSPSSIREALRYSPVCVGVALMPDEEGRYSRPDDWKDTHWATIRGDYENGDWKLKDTYPPFEKRVKANTQFYVAKVIEIDKQVIIQSWFDKFIAQLRALLGL